MGRGLNSGMNAAAKTLMLQVLRGYKWLISPLFPPACRYVPTCSEYAMEAVERYGAIRGSLFAGWRLLRCHPFAHGGYDPVPKKNIQEARGRGSPRMRSAAVHPGTSLDRKLLAGISKS